MWFLLCDDRATTEIYTYGHTLSLHDALPSDIRGLVDQCAHRRAPLSLGRVGAGGLIECPYHGWRYDGSGACVAIPNLVEGKRVPRNYRVAAPQVTEMDGFIHLRTSLDGTESLGAVPENPADWDVFEVSREIGRAHV